LFEKKIAHTKKNVTISLHKEMKFIFDKHNMERENAFLVCLLLIYVLEVL